MRKAHLTENLCPRPCFYLCRDVDGFEGRDGDDKAIPGPPRPAPPYCQRTHKRDMYDSELIVWVINLCHKALAYGQSQNSHYFLFTIIVR